MYANINLEGRIVSDLEIKTGKGDKKYVTFRMAVNQQFGEQQISSFFSCTGNELMATRMEKAGIKKGRLIHVSGNLTLREYTDRDGNTRTSADIGIQDWHFTGVKPKDEDQTEAAQETPHTAPVTAGTLHPEQNIEDETDLPL